MVGKCVNDMVQLALEMEGTWTASWGRLTCPVADRNADQGGHLFSHSRVNTE